MPDTDQAGQRIQITCLLVLTAIAVGAALTYLRPVLIPFVLALLLAQCLDPIIRVQRERFGMPRIVALISTGALGVLVLLLLGMIISAAVSQMAANASDYAARLSELAERVREALPLERLGIDEQIALEEHFRLSPDVLNSMVRTTVSSILNLTSKGLLVVIFMLFLLPGSDVTRALPPLWAEVRTRVQRYLITKVTVSAVTGITVWVILQVLGVQFALVFGVMAFILNFVPSIGSVIATILPLPVILLSPDLSAVSKVLAFALPGVVQFLVGNVIEPRIMGRSLNLHPVVVLLSLIFFGLIWGSVGMVLATPITAVIKILLDRDEHTAVVGRLMAGDLGAVEQANSS